MSDELAAIREELLDLRAEVTVLRRLVAFEAGATKGASADADDIVPLSVAWKVGGVGSEGTFRRLLKADPALARLVRRNGPSMDPATGKPRRQNTRLRFSRRELLRWREARR